MVPRGARLAARIARARALLVPAGHGRDGELPPNGWQSIFGGPAWTRTDDDGVPGEWYLHLFAPEQPDLNWTHPDVWPEHEDVLRFWFDRGVAGVRIDSAALLVKDPQLAEETPEPAPGEHPFIDRDELHDIYRRWRAIADGYAEPRVLVGEVWLPGPGAVRPLPAPGRAAHRLQLRLPRVPVGAGADAHLDRVGARRARAGGRADDLGALEPRRHAARHALRPRPTPRSRSRPSATGTPTDLERGTRRARAAALLAMALPGSMYIYQGEELGLPEVEDIPSERRQDPMWLRSGGVDPGRDGCRVPLPWAGDRPPYGFSPERSRPALARPAGRLGAAHRRGPVRATDARCSPSTAPACACAAPRPGRGDGALAWIPSTEVGPRLRARRAASPASSTSAPTRSHLPAGADVLIASDDLEGGALPQDTRSGSARRRADSVGDTIGPAPELSDRIGQRKGRTMKSTRMATTVAVAAASLLAVCASSVSGAAAKSGPRTTKTVTISVASLHPGQHGRGQQQFNNQVAAVREGESEHQGQAGRVPVDRPDLRGQARRRHAADGVHGARSPTPARSVTTASSPTSPPA